MLDFFFSLCVREQKDLTSSREGVRSGREKTWAFPENPLKIVAERNGCC